MKILKTFSSFIKDEDGHDLKLTIEMTNNNGIYGFACHLDPIGQHANDSTVTDDKNEAEAIFSLLCREEVLPLNLCSVLDDIYQSLPFNTSTASMPVASISSQTR
ncbi:MAG: hypothetical protein IJ736_06730 [Firmicutes bacterium]|nr:hypothetical protein [Bacillota bacterium]